MDKIGRMFLRHFTTFARVNMLIKMKKNYLLWAVTALIMLALQSCNNGKTYAEMKEEEADAINKYILENDIKVISEADLLRRIPLRKKMNMCCWMKAECICM